MTELGTDIELESRIDGGYWLTDPKLARRRKKKKKILARP